MVYLTPSFWVSVIACCVPATAEGGLGYSAQQGIVQALLSLGRDCVVTRGEREEKEEEHEVG